MLYSVDLQKDFVKMPLVARPRLLPGEAGCADCSEAGGESIDRNGSTPSGTDGESPGCLAAQLDSMSRKSVVSDRPAGRSKRKTSPGK